MSTNPAWIIVGSLLAGLLPTDALAYMDPGTGNAILSTVIGLLVAVGLFFKTFWYKLQSLFTRKHPSSENDES